MMLTAPDEPSKKAWRRRTRGARKEWTARQPEAERAADAAALAERALAVLADVRGAAGVGGATVTAYESWAVEPPTEELIARMTEAGVTVLVPVTLPDLDLDWRDAHDPDVPASRLGVDAIGRADVVFAPAQAVDVRTGTRLGQGGGCYDRALPRRRPGVPVLAVLNDHELAELDLPREETDVPVDGAITPVRTRWPLAHRG